VQKGTVKDKDSTSDYRYLALGDSYTIGESVCDTCRFPEQLKKELDERLKKQGDIKIIAKTGWTTTDLLNAIAQQKPSNDYDLVTLLIGVNNQYQGQPFSTYEKEFPELLNKAIQFAGGNKDNVIVVSIPDYAFTPFGQTKSDPSNISEELDRYNAFAKKIADERGVSFENITPITRNGLKNKSLVASDGLHPSKGAYNQFVELLSTKVEKILK
tara:strand:+ start:320370 stop:321011 length:642 start_codon:yes stop_codon:yes gene_type:complete